MEETKTILQTSHRLRYALIIEGFLVGGCAGIISIIYRQLLSYAEQWVQWLSAMMRQSLTWVVLGFALLLLIGFGISLLLRHEQLISGSGIPQIEAEVGGQLEENWLRVLWSKMAAGVLAALGGLSLGREGPSIQLGGMCGKGFGQLFHRVKIEQRYLITCGAAAGLSAAFNAPLAGIMFALEELHRSFSMSVIVSVMIASVTGDFLSLYDHSSRSAGLCTLAEQPVLDRHAKAACTQTGGAFHTSPAPVSNGLNLILPGHCAPAG